jgi:hypothetical protein
LCFAILRNFRRWLLGFDSFYSSQSFVISFFSASSYLSLVWSQLSFDSAAFSLYSTLSLALSISVGIFQNFVDSVSSVIYSTRLLRLNVWSRCHWVPYRFHNAYLSFFPLIWLFSLLPSTLRIFEKFIPRYVHFALSFESLCCSQSRFILSLTRLIFSRLSLSLFVCFRWCLTIFHSESAHEEFTAVSANRAHIC